MRRADDGVLNVVMLGPPGAGKGTQADRLAREHEVPKISTGDILREAVEKGTALGRLAKATMDAGELVGDEVMIGIVRERLARPDAEHGFVLDGFPRTVRQAVALDELLTGRGPLVIVDIAVPEEELIQRLVARRVCAQCGAIAGGMDDGGSHGRCRRCGGPLVQRSDDSLEVVRERLRVYARDTRPLVEYYRGRLTFRTIDGSRPPEQVAEEIKAVAEALADPVLEARKPGYDRL